MGIKYLNRFLKTQCKKSIQNVQISELKNKTLVIDTSIYLYRFLEKDCLLQNFFMMVAQCHQNQITPIFVFDGKPSEEKFQVLLERYYKRKEAIAEYNLCKETMEDEKAMASLTVEELDKLEKKMIFYKRESVKVTHDHIDQVRKLLKSLGVTYIDAPQEADNICAYYVKTNQAWACVSDDMDMFIYGCNYVIREWNIEKGQCTVYNRQSILNGLRIKDPYFSAVLILLGTDYHQLLEEKREPIYVSQGFQFYYQYQGYKQIHKQKKLGECDENIREIEDENVMDFYKWIIQEKKAVEENDLENLMKIYSMFQVPKSMDLNGYTCSTAKTIEWEILLKYLRPYGFIRSGGYIPLGDTSPIPPIPKMGERSEPNIIPLVERRGVRGNL